MKTALHAQPLEGRDNPSSFDWYVWAAVSDPNDPDKVFLTSVGANWVGGVAPPASGASVEVPAGTAPMTEDHLTSLRGADFKSWYSQKVYTNGLYIAGGDIRSGRFVSTGNLVVGGGVIADEGLTEFDARNGAIYLGGDSDLYLFGAGWTGDVKFRGDVSLGGALGTVYLDNINLAGDAGTDRLYFDGPAQVTGLYNSSTSAIELIDVDTSFTLDAGRRFTTGAVFKVHDGASLSVYQGAHFETSGTEQVVLAPGAHRNAGLVVSGEGSNVYVGGGGATVKATNGVVFADGAELDVHSSPDPGQNQHLNYVEGDTTFWKSTLDFNTWGLGILQTWDLDIVGSTMDFAAIRGAGSDVVRAGDVLIADRDDAVSSVTATLVGTGTQPEAWVFLDEFQPGASGTIDGGFDPAECTLPGGGLGKLLGYYYLNVS